jgi:signal transduction histidine kinase/DNA-binding response OmpR family regulator
VGFLPLTACCQQPVFQPDSSQGSWLLNDYLQVLETNDEALSFEDLQNPAWKDRFLPYSDFIKNYRTSIAGGKVLLDPARIYWWRLQMRNNLDQPLRQWVLHTGKSNFTEVYIVGQDGRLMATHYTGWLTPIAKKDYNFGNRTQERIALDLPEGASATLYGRVSVVNQKEPYLWVRLSDEDFFQNWNFIRSTRLDWTFIGFLLTFILFNLLIFASTSDRVFLWHALFQTGIFLYLLEFFNALPDLIWIRDKQHLIQLFIYAALCLMDVSYLQFIRLYMDMKERYAAWDRYFRWFTIARLVFAAGVISVYWFTKNMKWADDLTALFLVGQYLVMAVLLTWLFGLKDRKSLFLVAGTAVFVTGVVLNALAVIEGSGLQFSYTQFGVVGEVVLFMLGMGYRMKLLQTEEREVLRLKDLDDFKSRFYTNVTHEFRTPLTVIMGNSEIGETTLMQKDDPNWSSLSARFDAIRRNAAQLLRLVNRLLDLSKLQSGKMALQNRRSDVAGYLRYLVQSFQSFAMGRDVQLLYLSELDHFEMDFDAEKLQDVMHNLLSNAVKFSPPGSEVRIKTTSLTAAGALPERLQISVKDQGQGIPPEALPHIFDRFFTTKDSGNPAGGSGVGLALVKELVELMAGTTAVESEPGKGSTFTVTLPVYRKAPSSDWATAAPVRPAAEIPLPLPSPAEVQDNSEKPLCLIIDDNADVVRYLQTLLENEYAMAVAYDGKRGIEKALELLPDIVISDVMLPEKDGLEVCDTLKNDERTSHIPVILLTAKAAVEDRLSGLQRGADAYLQKPFNREELFLQLKKSLELRWRLMRHFSKSPQATPTESTSQELVIEDAFLRKAQMAVEENLSDDEFDIHHLCRALTLSRAQLHRKLTALTGKSATHFIRSVRLEKAKDLLAKTDLTIAEIAYEVGFRDPNYFSRTFAEEFGAAPSETRK